MITLLLVFFVYLFSISKLDISKFFEARESLNKEFSSNIDAKSHLTFQERQEQLAQMINSLREMIKEKELEHMVFVSHIDDFLDIRLGTKVLFDSGSALLKDAIKPLLIEMSDIFIKNPGVVIVEGHTDDLPIKTPQFPSNWELSAARAGSVARFLTGHGLEPSRMKIVGYGPYNPLVPNTTEENRAKNRRIRITLEPDDSYVIRKEVGNE